MIHGISKQEFAKIALEKCFRCGSSVELKNMSAQYYVACPKCRTHGAYEKYIPELVVHWNMSQWEQANQSIQDTRAKGIHADS